MTFTGTLYPYQQAAVDHMIDIQCSLLCFDMGLGKTPMTIAAVETLMDEGRITAPCYVIALSSLKYQWKTAVEKFSDDSHVLVVDGTKAQREAQYAKAADWEDQGIDYVVLNYEQIVNDWEIIKALPIGAMVCDEATALKSFKSKRSKKTKALAKEVPVRFALSGTPIENGKPEELFSIMQFVDDSVLGRFDLFDRAFIVRNHWGGVSRYRNLDTLHDTMMQVCDRKSQTDPDVAPYLPNTIERDPVLVPMDRKAAKVYNIVADSLLEDLEEAATLFGGGWSLEAHYGGKSDVGGPADQLRGQIMSKVTAMRMLCDHPDLLRISANRFMNGWHEIEGDEVNILGSRGGSKYLAELLEEGLLDGLDKTPKLDYLTSYLADFLDNDPDHKAVVFSAFVPTTDLIQERLKVSSETYTGRMNAKAKEEAKVRFQTDPSVRVLISSDAGGYGVDLPQANLLVNYDLPWSSGLAGQRNARIVRASSRWTSVVIDTLLAKGSLEERQYQMIKQKNAVAGAVIDGEGINLKGGIDLTVGSLKEYLQTVRP